jgi:hypothetical protein
LIASVSDISREPGAGVAPGLLFAFRENRKPLHLLPQTGSRCDYLRSAATKSVMIGIGLWKSAIVLSMFHR